MVVEVVGCKLFVFIGGFGIGKIIIVLCMLLVL